MKATRKKYLKIFFTGGLLSLVTILFFDLTGFRLISFIFAYPPLALVFAVGTPADWVCPLLAGDMCRGLGFDGGPLFWLELLTVFFLEILWGGFLFLTFYFLYKKRQV